jgi:hypothetical protein
MGARRPRSGPASKARSRKVLPCREPGFVRGHGGPYLGSTGLSIGVQEVHAIQFSGDLLGTGFCLRSEGWVEWASFRGGRPLRES